MGRVVTNLVVPEHHQDPPVILIAITLTADVHKPHLLAPRREHMALDGDAGDDELVELVTNNRALEVELPRLTRAIVQRTGRMDGTFRISVTIEPLD